jgi:hypothetical protein
MFLAKKCVFGILYFQVRKIQGKKTKGKLACPTIFSGSLFRIPAL